MKSIRSPVRNEIKIIPIHGLSLENKKKTNSNILPNIKLNVHIYLKEYSIESKKQIIKG